jgi:hypothetical protein
MNIAVPIKKVICTITYQIKSSYTCDLVLSQIQPPAVSDELGDFERIKNHKILQISANEGVWCHVHSPFPSTDKMLCFFRKPLAGIAFILLFDVPYNFLDWVMFMGFEFSGKGISTIDQQPLDWRIYQV